MCGICGAVWSSSRSALDASEIKEMTDALRHRGPDDEGILLSELGHHAAGRAMPGAALGFRRLSIIDVHGGRQPIASEDGAVHVVCNGEIYNYRALRRRLEGAGHRFRSRSDSETIVHLYEEEGTRCFEHLNGMFAIAIWDAPRGRLVLARDRLGQKPLVYRHEADRLLFASELKSLLRVPDIPRELDPSAVDQYLTYQYVPHPHSIYRGFNKLPPAHLAVYEEGRLDVQAYWRPDFSHQQPIGEAEAVQRVRDLLNSSVQLRMQSDVPLGAFLSGGVDSSLIATLMQRQTGQPIKTFSIGFPVEEYDERRYARQIAERIGSEHHEFEVRPDAVQILPKLVEQYDEPFADSSAVATWYLSELTRQHVTVSLSGDGGDELFAGYPRYRAVRLGHTLDASGPLRKILASRLWQRLPGSMRQKSFVRRLKRFAGPLGMTPSRRYLEWIAIFPEARRAELYTDEFLAGLPDSDPFEFLGQAWMRASRRDCVTTASLADLVTYLPCDLMTKVDMASMAHSLECRQPLLDHRLVELAISLPVKLKYRRGKGKWLLRKAFGELLPEEIWSRPKMGFGVPLDHWFRNELREMTHDLLAAGGARCHDIFRAAAIRRLIDEHQSEAFDHSYRLWALLVFESWLQRWS